MTVYIIMRIVDNIYYYIVWYMNLYTYLLAQTLKIAEKLWNSCTCEVYYENRFNSENNFSYAGSPEKII